MAEKNEPLGEALAKQEADGGLKTQRPKDALEQMLEPYKREVARALPAGWSAERFMRTMQTLMRANPKLMDKNVDKVTLLAAMMRSAQLGLTPGVHSHLVPFKNGKTGKTEVVFINGYKGVAELVRRSGEIAKITTAVVREGDEFSVSLGSDPKVVHVPSLSSTDGRGLTHVYSMVWYKSTGEWDVEVMDKAQVDKVRAGSKAKGASPWSEHYDEMARKTVLLRHSKRLPMSDEDRRALDADGIVGHTISGTMLDVPDAEGDVFHEVDPDDVVEEAEVVEVEGETIDPDTGEIVWEGDGEPPSDEG